MGCDGVAKTALLSLHFAIFRGVKSSARRRYERWDQSWRLLYGEIVRHVFRYFCIRVYRDVKKKTPQKNKKKKEEGRLEYCMLWAGKGSTMMLSSVFCLFYFAASKTFHEKMYLKSSSSERSKAWGGCGLFSQQLVLRTRSRISIFFR